MNYKVGDIVYYIHRADNDDFDLKYKYKHYNIKGITIEIHRCTIRKITYEVDNAPEYTLTSLEIPNKCYIVPCGSTYIYDRIGEVDIEFNNIIDSIKEKYETYLFKNGHFRMDIEYIESEDNFNNNFSNSLQDKTLKDVSIKDM